MCGSISITEEHDEYTPFITPSTTCQSPSWTKETARGQVKYNQHPGEKSRASWTLRAINTEAQVTCTYIEIDKGGTGLDTQAKVM